jgi:hypothetical protein
MSVATSNSKRPLRKPFQGVFALALGAVGMQHGDGVVVAFEQMGDAVGAVFGAAENNHGLVIDAFEHFAQQIALLVFGDGIDDVLDSFRRGAARTDLDGLRDCASPI